MKKAKVKEPSRGVGWCDKCSYLQPMYRVTGGIDYRHEWRCRICGHPHGPTLKLK